MLKNTEDVSVSQSKGLNTVYNILSLEKDQSPNLMDVIVNFDGSIEERMGSNTQNAVIIAASAAAGFSTNSTGTVNASIRSFWNFDEASGSRADVLGNTTLLDSGNTGSLAGIKNQAALFNAATQQCLYAVNPPLLTNNSSFTISTWVYLNSTSPSLERTIVSKRDEANGSNYSLLLHMDGTDQSTTFTDSESIPKTMTANGNAKIVTAQSKFGGASGSFDGTNSYVSTASTTNFNFGTGDFTIDMWFRTTAHSGNFTLLELGNGASAGIEVLWNSANEMDVRINGNFYSSATFNPVDGTWYHFAASRQSGSIKIFINGVQSGATQSSTESVTVASASSVGSRQGTTQFLNGYIDEVRVLTGSAAYTIGFTPPTSAYTNPLTATGFEYWLYVNTDNIATFKVSSAGNVFNGTVSASSFGALTISTWYNIVAWFNSAGAQIGISVNLATNSGSYTSGMLTGSAPLTFGAINSGSNYFMDGRIDESVFWSKVLTTGERTDVYNGGSGNTYQRSFDTQSWASFDFGASAIRWLTVAAGTGLYASSNLGVSFVNIATDRTATYQYLDRSKNVLVATSDAYDTPLYWSGSAGSFAASLNSNATACKFSINFQGFLILLNSSSRKRGFFYNDENTQLTGPWTNNFDIPSSQDDEITAAFILRRYLYISTRYKLFRVNYVGGNPDWQFLELKNWGFIPRTVKKVILTNQTPGVGLYYSVGEIAIGLTWDRKIRVFDGSNDQIISSPIEKDNGLCDFAIDKISYFGSGPVISFAEVNPNQNVYHLCVAIGESSSKTTHFINYDGRGFAFYPWSNMNFNCMCMAESANQRFLMAFDRSGRCHMMNSGTLDSNTTIVNGIFESPIAFSKSPSQSTKGHRTDLFFSNTSAGQLIYSDRIDARTSYGARRTFSITGSGPKIFHYESVDTPETYNMYQFKLQHNQSNNSAAFQPWRLIRYDHFGAGFGIGKND